MLSISGCQQDARSKAKANEKRETTAPREVAMTAAKKPVSVETPAFHLLKDELLEAGANPREVLRYGRLQYAARLDSHVTAREGKKSIVLRRDLAFTASPSGRAGIVGLAPTGVEGARAAIDIDTRGLVTRVSGAAPLDVKRELVAMLLRHLGPLPKEEIGIGARWRVKYAIARGGVFIAHNTIYELTKRSGDELTLRFETTESAEQQPITADGARVGELHALKGSAAGSITVSLATPVAQRGSADGSSTYHATTNAGDEIFREATTKLELFARSTRLGERGEAGREVTQ